jgi:hypothetical protein
MHLVCSGKSKPYAPCTELCSSYSVQSDTCAPFALSRCFVIGLSGVFTGSKLTSLGLVVRKIKSQNIFSYDWVHDAIVAGAKDKAERKLKVRLRLTVQWQSQWPMPAMD